MPSPSPMQSVQHRSIHSIHHEDAHGYRQTMYHDKAGVQIAECRRRRPGVSRRVEPSAQTYADFVLYPVDSAQSSLNTHSNGSSHCAAPKMKPAESSSKQHVTYAKHSSTTRPKPAIIQRASEPRGMLFGEEKTYSYFSGEPTPPPTPRLTRSSTPELSELKEAPFCDCGVRGHVVRRCRTCSKEVDL